MTIDLTLDVDVEEAEGAAEGAECAPQEFSPERRPPGRTREPGRAVRGEARGESCGEIRGESCGEARGESCGEVRGESCGEARGEGGGEVRGEGGGLQRVRSLKGPPPAPELQPAPKSAPGPVPPPEPPPPPGPVESAAALPGVHQVHDAWPSPAPSAPPRPLEPRVTDERTHGLEHVNARDAPAPPWAEPIAVEEAPLPSQVCGPWRLVSPWSSAVWLSEAQVDACARGSGLQRAAALPPAPPTWAERRLWTSGWS